MFDIGQDEPDWDAASRDLYAEAEWQKTNPGLGITVTRSALKAEALEAKQDPQKRPSYFRTTLCLWETSLSSFVQMDLWDRCAHIPVPDLTGRLCFGGCDLSKYGDLSAFVLVFPPLPGAPHWYVESQAWIPGDTVIERTREEGAPYRRWAAESKIIPTPGPVIDYGAIADHISVCAEVYQLREVAFDPKFAHDLTGTLMERHGTSFCAEFRQTFVDFSAPIVETERLYRTGLLAHGGDEVLAYCAGNVQVERDAQENPMLRKGRHDRFARIDSFVALVMAVGRAKLGGHGGARMPPPDRITF